MTFGIEQQRLLTDRITLVALWFHVPLIYGVCMFVGVGWTTLTGAALAVAAISTLLLFSAPVRTPGRLVAAVGLMVQISLAVAALAGHPWQTDMHMYYFAMLAVLVSYIDWRVILAATATVAVHHLGLNFFYVAAIYPGESDFGRVLVHAVVLVIEASALVAISLMICSLLDSLSQSMERAQEAERMSRRSQVDSDQLISILSHALGRLARKDLSFRIEDDLPHAFVAVREDFNSAVLQLESVVETVAQSSSTISSGAGEISAASTDLSRRTETQAASLEETTAALEQITRTVMETASEARSARKAVSLAQQEADVGSEVVTRTIDAIRRIENASNQITQIISVIDEISFQTNLLALNAGVEAARAGETGRGFAVVASEVRALAQRSTAAAQDIKKLISSSTSEVSKGVELVEATGAALAQIVVRVSEVSTTISNIVKVAEEQSGSLSEVNTALRHLDVTTQQNAAMVEETSAATENLNHQSEMLNSLIREFSLRRNSPTTSRAA
ncbi:methyl-accepting chemotaxis protein [Aestuariivirga sp.]|uniref:methyl-accepting chemotaxis protein n=1 Tax=Aestuariivirga sp. TaxID=2650926 RepID=UPI0037834434